MLQKFFRVPFANSGDKVAIPDAAQPDGSMSYSEGFGLDYELDPGADPDAKRIPRDKTNQYLFDVTGALRQYQVFGTPEWIEAAQNDGVPYSYAKYARVVWDGGAGEQVWQSLIDGNTVEPGADPTKWTVAEPFNFGTLVATQGEAETVNNSIADKLMTPQRTWQAMRAGAVTVDVAGVAYRADKRMNSFIPDNTSALQTHFLMNRGSGVGTGAQIATVGDGANGVARLAVLAGAIERLSIVAASGNIGFSKVNPVARVDIGSIANNQPGLYVRNNSDFVTSGIFVNSFGGGIFGLYDPVGVEKIRIDATGDNVLNSGNVLIGTTSGPYHTLRRNETTQDGGLFQILGGDGKRSALFQPSFNEENATSTAALRLGSSANGRSINGRGTGNFSGADVAEYYTKTNDAGTIRAGDICGVDNLGLLTDRFDAAIKFRVKSTNPHIVGNDTWGNGLGARPEEPAKSRNIREITAAPGPKPTFIPYQYPEGATKNQRIEIDAANEILRIAYERVVADWQKADAAYLASKATWETEQRRIDTAHSAALRAYETEMKRFNAALEAERAKVDRIAMNGRVPLNITGSFNVGDYVIPKRADDGSILAVAISPDALDAAGFRVYRSRVGQIEAVLPDGRPFVEVHQG